MFASNKALCLQISRAEYTCPDWFTPSQKKLISRILEPNSRRVELQNVMSSAELNIEMNKIVIFLSFFFLQRITIADIVENEWFQINYEPASGIEFDEKINLDDVNAAFNSTEVITNDIYA